MTRTSLLAAALVLNSLAACAAHVSLPRTGIGADEVALLINDDDPLSVMTGEYYQSARRIPPENVIHLRFATGRSALPEAEFAEIRRQIDSAVPARVQTFAVAWTSPYRVGCMSLTSALALGYDTAYCSTQCGTTKASTYFNSPSLYPADDHRLRPAMMLAGKDFDAIKSLIDRGVASDHSFPDGHAYLLTTADKARNVRAAYFELTARQLEGVFPLDVIESDAIESRSDVLFYFTGLDRVPHLETLAFQPGTLADHLTSFGGQLTDSSQMSSLRWLESGATASYGTVVEPCNHPQKFPFPAVAMYHYATGATAIEAYWKSVAWPGEGVFIGEPLARPFAPRVRKMNDGVFALEMQSPAAGALRLWQSPSPAGPFRISATQNRPAAIHRGKNLVLFRLPDVRNDYFRIQFTPEMQPAQGRKD